jgi:hypothetical protein
MLDELDTPDESAPLLGTMHFQAIDNAPKTVSGQSGKRHCYSELLQFSRPNNPVNHCKSVTSDSGKCYPEPNG